MKRTDSRQVDILAKEYQKGMSGETLAALTGELRQFTAGVIRKHSNLIDTVNFTWEDAESACLLGLIKALKSWEPNRGSFMTYYWNWARDQLQEEAYKTKAIAVPRAVRQQLGKEAGSTAEEGSRLKAGYRAQLVSSLDRKIDEDEGEADGYLAQAAPDDVEAEAILDIEGWYCEIPALDAALRALKEKPRKVLILRYGLDRKGPRSAEQVARELGYSNVDSVYVIEKRAAADVQRYMSEHAADATDKKGHA